MSSTPGIYYPVGEPQSPGQFTSLTTVQLQSCLTNRPMVTCTRRADCERWMNENCTEEDRQIADPYCDVGGFCHFPTDGRKPPFRS